MKKKGTKRRIAESKVERNRRITESQIRSLIREMINEANIHYAKQLAEFEEKIRANKLQIPCVS